MEISKVYPPDAVYDNPEDVPEDVMILLMMVTGVATILVYEKFLIYAHICCLVHVKTNKRYAGSAQNGLLRYNQSFMYILQAYN